MYIYVHQITERKKVVPILVCIDHNIMFYLNNGKTMMHPFGETPMSLKETLPEIAALIEEAGIMITNKDLFKQDFAEEDGGENG